VTYRKISNEEVSADMSNTPAVLLQPGRSASYVLKLACGLRAAYDERVG